MLFNYNDREFPIETKWVKSCLFIAVSGSNSFGWDKPNSDLDLVHVWMPLIENLISPFWGANKNRHSIHGDMDRREYPIQNFLRLLAKGNGNALDNLFEPKLYEMKEQVKELQDIVKTHIHKGFIHHCLGYSKSIKKDFDISSRVETTGLHKLILTRYRVLLQGFCLLDGKIEYNLPRLLKIVSKTDWASPIAEKVLDDYLASENNNILKQSKLLIAAKLDTDTLHEMLEVELSDSLIEHSTIEVPLDRWMIRFYNKNPEYERYLKRGN